MRPFNNVAYFYCLTCFNWLCVYFSCLNHLTSTPNVIKRHYSVILSLNLGKVEFNPPNSGSGMYTLVHKLKNMHLDSIIR
ncbi:hypothetical protein VNO78_00720 [Psophocarpus tetragonolobus]|uniref:Uncharacterized protein n=1 Tax=Psophocarpus tetragonolobus TaxID=3891 RepID=A0AAN9XUA7_PSOTE